MGFFRSKKSNYSFYWFVLNRYNTIQTNYDFQFLMLWWCCVYSRQTNKKLCIESKVNNNLVQFIEKNQGHIISKKALQFLFSFGKKKRRKFLPLFPMLLEIKTSSEKNRTYTFLDKAFWRNLSCFLFFIMWQSERKLLCWAFSSKILFWLMYLNFL